MFSKNKDASSTPAKQSKSKKEPKANTKANKPSTASKKKDAIGAKVEQELSDVAKSHHIRVSSPYGYYPEDIDPLITQLEKDISNLEKENKQLTAQLHEETELRKAASQELAKMKMEVSLFDYPDVSAEESFAMLGRIDSITGKYNSEPVSELQQRFNSPESTPTLPKPKIKIKPKNKEM